MMLAVSEEVILSKRLESLKKKHRDLDQKLRELTSNIQDQLSLLRMKKEKLILRDEINRIEQIMYPDLIA